MEGEKTGSCLEVAEVVLRVTSDFPLKVGKIYQNFLSQKKPEVSIRAYYKRIPAFRLSRRDLVFDSEMIWKLYRWQGDYVLTLESPAFGSTPYRAAVFKSDFSKGEIYSRPLNYQGGFIIDPLEFPLSYVLMVGLLSQRRGVMFHACGIDDNGKGYLFLGNSTHGKSTTAKLWFEEEATVLNDDRIVAREKDGGLWMYGTPWYGDYRGVSPKGLPIHKIFFLRHGKENSVVPKNGIEAVSMALTRCFPPIWDKEGMDYTVDFCYRLARNVSCYELNFVPDRTAVDFVRRLK